MSVFESPGKLVKDWKPQELPSESEYCDSLVDHLTKPGHLLLVQASLDRRIKY